MPQPTATYTFLDYSGEKSVVEVALPAIDGVNLLTLTEAALDWIAGAGLAQVIKELSLCTMVKSQVHLEPEVGQATLPPDPMAQREMGLMVTYQDVVNTKKYRITIPGPDMDTLGVPGTDLVKSDDTLWTDFVTAFEAGARSPDGNAVNILEGRFVGRNK